MRVNLNAIFDFTLTIAGIVFPGNLLPNLWSFQSFLELKVIEAFNVMATKRSHRVLYLFRPSTVVQSSYLKRHLVDLFLHKLQKMVRLIESYSWQHVGRRVSNLYISFPALHLLPSDLIHPNHQDLGSRLFVSPVSQHTTVFDLVPLISLHTLNNQHIITLF